MAKTPFTLISAAFGHGKAIPAHYTRCHGDDTSPPLSWQNGPSNTQSYALIVDDPDAPDPAKPKMTWVHWVVYNLPANCNSLPEGAASTGLPEGTRLCLNDWKQPAYGGPSPPKGCHRYFFKLYALDTMLSDLGKDATKATLLEAMNSHILDQTELVGTYQKKK